MISIIPLSGAMLLLYWIRYIIRKRKEQPLAVPILFTCFFLPKINLLKVSAISTAGIRVDRAVRGEPAVGAAVPDARV